jgi:hypothetical protein
MAKAKSNPVEEWQAETRIDEFVCEWPNILDEKPEMSIADARKLTGTSFKSCCGASATWMRKDEFKSVSKVNWACDKHYVEVLCRECSED